MATPLPAGPSAGTLGGFAISEAAAVIAERVGPSVAVVGNRGGNGAGVVWRPDGLIVTNRHVVRGDGADVLLADGRRLPGRVVARHEARDLALLMVEADGLPAV